MPWHADALAALAAHGVALSPEQLGKLDEFAALVVRRGRSLNLVSAADCGRVYDRHLFDCLTAVPLISWSGKHALDIGSGAGLPGIPLAIVRPDARFALVERARKRAAFLLGAVKALDLANVEVHWADVKEMTRTEGSACRVDIVTMRAVAKTSEAIALARAVIQPDGRVLLWQTADQWKREPTPHGFDAQWCPTPSRDEIKRGIRVCRLPPSVRDPDNLQTDSFVERGSVSH